MYLKYTNILRIHKKSFYSENNKCVYVQEYLGRYNLLSK